MSWRDEQHAGLKIQAQRVDAFLEQRAPQWTNA